MPLPPSQPARADSTGPNGTNWEAMTSESRPVDRNSLSDFSTSDNVDCTNSREPPSDSKLTADAQNGSGTKPPSRPAFQAQTGPAVIGITSVSPAGGVGT